MLPVASKPTLLQDFDKECKDLFEKHFSKNGEWRVQTKAKAANGSYGLSTRSQWKSDLLVDIEAITRDGAISGKLTVNPTLNNFKAVVTAPNYMDQYFEARIEQNSSAANKVMCELHHHTLKPLANGRIHVQNKFTCSDVDVGVSIAAANNVELGIGGTCNYKTRYNNCTFSLRAQPNSNSTISLQTDKTFRNYQMHAVTMLPVVPKFQPLVAFAGRMNSSLALDGEVVVQWGCQVVEGNTVKARLTKNLYWTLVYMANLKDNWKLALTFDKSYKTGVILTLE